MAKYDIESFLRDLDAYLKAKLPAKITAVNADKGDSLLEAIPAEAFFVLTANNKMEAYKRFIFTGIVDLDTIQAGPNLAEQLSAQVLVSCTDIGDPDEAWRMLRYQRAIKEVIAGGFTDFRSGLKIVVKSLVPVTYREDKESPWTRVIGVTVQATLA